jgi:PhnB protein
MPVKAIPEGYHSVTPYLIIDGAAAALDFYKKALALLN